MNSLHFSRLSALLVSNGRRGKQQVSLETNPTHALLAAANAPSYLRSEIWCIFDYQEADILIGIDLSQLSMTSITVKLVHAMHGGTDGSRFWQT